MSINQISSVDQPSLLNQPNIIENSGFFNENLVDGRGLPKIGKRYELQLALHQRHKDGLEKEFGQRFFNQIDSKEDFEGLMIDLCELFGIDKENFTIADAKIILPSHTSMGYEPQVSMLGLGSGDYNEYFKPRIKKEGDAYVVAIQDSTEGVYLTEESKGDLRTACIEQAFVAYKNYKQKYYKHLLNMTKYMDKYPSDSNKSKAIASMDIDIATNILEIDLSNMSEGELFKLLPEHVNYIPKYEENKEKIIKLIGHLSYDEEKKKYNLDYIIGENRYIYEKDKIEVGKKQFGGEADTLEELVRSMYNFFYVNSDLFVGDQCNTGEKDETALRNNLSWEFRNDGKENINNLLYSYNLSQDENEKREIQQKVISLVDINSPSAYPPQYYLGLSVSFDLSQDLQKIFAIQAIQSGLIGKLTRYQQGISLTDVRKKKGIDLVQTEDHAINTVYDNSDVKKIAKGFGITDDELSTAVLDVYLLYKIGRDNNGFIKSYHINSHNTYDSDIAEKILPLINEKDLKYIQDLEYASGQKIIKEESSDLVEDKIQENINNTSADFPSILENNAGRNRKLLNFLCNKFNINVKEIAEEHINKYNSIKEELIAEIKLKLDDEEIDSLTFSKYLDQLLLSHDYFGSERYLKNPIQRVFFASENYSNGLYKKESIYDYFIGILKADKFINKELYSRYKDQIDKQSKEYCEGFNEFVRDVELSENENKYPEQDIFLIEKGDQFIVTDDIDKYGKEMLSIIKFHNYDGLDGTVGYISCNDNYFAPKGRSGSEYYKKRLNSRKNEYLGAIIKTLPNKYKDEFEQGKLKVDHLIK